jgi:hypothetical protein
MLALRWCRFDSMTTTTMMQPHRTALHCTPWLHGGSDRTTAAGRPRAGGRADEHRERTRCVFFFDGGPPRHGTPAAWAKARVARCSRRLPCPALPAALGGNASAPAASTKQGGLPALTVAWSPPHPGPTHGRTLRGAACASKQAGVPFRLFGSERACLDYTPAVSLNEGC